MRCCVYKRRAILAERIKLATGGNRKNPNVIEALDIACDDCRLADMLSQTTAADVSHIAVRMHVPKAR